VKVVQQLISRLFYKFSFAFTGAYGVAMGIKRGKCQEEGCSKCPHYQAADDGDGGPCLNCGHFPGNHELLGKVDEEGKLSSKKILQKLQKSKSIEQIAKSKSSLIIIQIGSQNFKQKKKSSNMGFLLLSRYKWKNILRRS
jgi:hypothetical protein